MMLRSKKQDTTFLKVLKSQAGMSLMEILIALTLLGIAGTFVATAVFDRLQEGRVESAKIQVQRLGEILKDYRRKCGAYPSSDQGLDALISKPGTGKECKRYPPNGFVEDGKIPMDPWDNEFIYESNGRKYNIISLGADGEEGGDDYDADISSAEL
jgi:general secretion pathway protein G